MALFNVGTPTPATPLLAYNVNFQGDLLLTRARQILTPIIFAVVLGCILLAELIDPPPEMRIYPVLFEQHPWISGGFALLLVGVAALLFLSSSKAPVGAAARHLFYDEHCDLVDINSTLQPAYKVSDVSRIIVEDFSAPGNECWKLTMLQDEILGIRRPFGRFRFTLNQADDIQSIIRWARDRNIPVDDRRGAPSLTA